MNPVIGLVVLAAVVVLILLILKKQPVWLALLSAGTVGIVLLSGSDVALGTLGTLAFSTISQYAYVVIPLFILMGALVSKSGVAEDVFAVAAKVTRRLPGGLGVATVLACGGFAAVTGASAATVATVGRVSVSQMARYGYRRDAAGALVAMGGTLGVLIPPSVLIVVLGIVSGESIGRLLLAGVIPGIVTMFIYALFTIGLARLGFFRRREAPTSDGVRVHEPALAGATSAAEDGGKELTGSGRPAGGAGDGADTGNPAAPAERITLKHLIGTAHVTALFAVIFGGIYSGVLTVTESGAIAAAAATVILVIRCRRNLRQAWRSSKEALLETGSLASMIFALIIGGSVFAYFIARSGVPVWISDMIAAAGLPPLAIVIAGLVVMLILGSFLDSYSILILTVPLLYPILSAQGVDGIWFGILAVKAIEIGLVTPPFGLNVFVISGVVPGLKAERVFRYVVPFVLADLVAIGVLIAFPSIVTWLPEVAFA